MKNFLILLLLFVGHCYGSDDERIVGGINAPTRVKYQVSLQDVNNNHQCGGALINSAWIITTATCVKGSPRKVGYGSNSLSRLSRCDLNPAKQHIHPLHTGNPFYYYDIGLIKMECNIPESNQVGYVQFPPVDLPVNSPVFVTGWGILSHPGGPAPDRLQQLATRTISYEDCARRFSNPNMPTIVLCTLTGAGQGICYGDAGGPVVNSVTANPPLIYGLISGMAPCATGLPDLNVRLTDGYGMSWIINTILRK